MSQSYCDPERRQIDELSPKDRRDLARLLDVKDAWKEIAQDPRLNLSYTDVSLMAQSSRAGLSPTEKLLSHMNKRRYPIIDLYLMLKKTNMVSPMVLLHKYVPHSYHVLAEKPYSLNPDDDVFQSNPIHQPPPIDMSDLPSVGLPHFNIDFPVMQLQNTSTPYHTLPTNDTVPESDQSADYENMMQLNVAKLMASLRSFKYEDISKNTEGFSSKYVIADGYFGPMYKVELLHTKYAAKVFKRDMKYDGIQADLQLARNFNHQNIVPITGQCADGPEFILLYDYMPNGSLRQQLDEKMLDMQTRVNILHDAAVGLNYLHSYNPPFLHRNIKSSTILLDDHMKGKLCDFNLARAANKSENFARYTHKSTKLNDSLIDSSRGYLAREVTAGKPSTKSDVYAFGVVIYEVCTGLQAYDMSRLPNERLLVDYIESHVKGPEEEVQQRDRSIRWHDETYWALFKLARHCTEERKAARPSVDMVIGDLKNIMETMNPEFCPEPEEDDEEDDEASIQGSTDENSLSLDLNDSNQVYMPTPAHQTVLAPSMSAGRPISIPAGFSLPAQFHHHHPPHHTVMPLSQSGHSYNSIYVYNRPSLSLPKQSPDVPYHSQVSDISDCATHYSSGSLSEISLNSIQYPEPVQSRRLNSVVEDKNDVSDSDKTVKNSIDSVSLESPSHSDSTNVDVTSSNAEYSHGDSNDRHTNDGDRDTGVNKGDFRVPDTSVSNGSDTEEEDSIVDDEADNYENERKPADFLDLLENLSMSEEEEQVDDSDNADRPANFEAFARLERMPVE